MSFWHFYLRICLCTQTPSRFFGQYKSDWVDSICSFFKKSGWAGSTVFFFGKSGLSRLITIVFSAGGGGAIRTSISYQHPFFPGKFGLSQCGERKSGQSGVTFCGDQTSPVRAGSIDTDKSKWIKHDLCDTMHTRPIPRTSRFSHPSHVYPLSRSLATGLFEVTLHVLVHVLPGERHRGLQGLRGHRGLADLLRSRMEGKNDFHISLHNSCHVVWIYCGLSSTRSFGKKLDFEAYFCPIGSGLLRVE